MVQINLFALEYNNLIGCYKNFYIHRYLLMKILYISARFIHLTIMTNRIPKLIALKNIA